MSVYLMLSLLCCSNSSDHLIMADPKPNTYSAPFAFIYTFNLIVGVGALTLPKAVNEAGLVLGTVLLVSLCIISYITATYVVETMAAANAYYKMEERKKKFETEVSANLTDNKKLQLHTEALSSPGDGRSSPLNSSINEQTIGYLPIKPSQASSYCIDVSGVHNPNSKVKDVNITETTPLISATSDSDDDYEIDKKFELGSMASLFFPTFGIVIYYIIVCLYLFGDLAIYAVAAPTSVAKVVCDLVTNSNNNTDNSSEHCFGGLTRLEAYYIFLGIFIACIGPFTFFNMTKTKILQLITTVMRYVAFISMITLAIIRIANGHRSLPPMATFSGLPSLFGISIYSFMCQHSLPGIVTPIRQKKGIYGLLGDDFIVVLLFYLVLSITGAIAFERSEMQQLYTLDFFNPRDSIPKLVVGTYLALFPVFTLSASFPIITVTLRENLKSLGKTILKKWRGDKDFPFIIDRILFPLLVLTPPTIIAYSIQQDDLLVSVTGSFPGVGVQYLIPTALVFMARYTLKKKFRTYENKYKSPFSNIIIIGLVLLWTFVSVILIIINMSITPPKQVKHPI